MARMRRQPEQMGLRLSVRGGARPGAGRPRGHNVSHARRQPLSHNHPVHVTLRVCKGVYGLRSRRSFHWIERAFRAARGAKNARFVHYTVQGNHIHLIVEAENSLRLSRFVQGFEIRVARWLNRMMGRHGRVFADRYHARALRTPREVRLAVAYVLKNAAKHYGGGRTASVDPYSSAATFGG